MGHYRMIPDKSVEILLGELSRDIAQRTPGTGDFPTAVEGLELFRRNEPAPPVSCLVPPSIVLVADGAKIMWVGGEPYEYNAEKFLITSLDLPASSEILQASTSQPCVGVAYKLDQRVLMELIAQGNLPPVKKRDAGTSVGIGTIPRPDGRDFTTRWLVTTSQQRAKDTPLHPERSPECRHYDTPEHHQADDPPPPCQFDLRR